jgi:hypothetical protein
MLSLPGLQRSVSLFYLRIQGPRGSTQTVASKLVGLFPQIDEEHHDGRSVPAPDAAAGVPAGEHGDFARECGRGGRPRADGGQGSAEVGAQRGAVSDLQSTPRRSQNKSYARQASNRVRHVRR